MEWQKRVYVYYKNKNKTYLDLWGKKQKVFTMDNGRAAKKLSNIEADPGKPNNSCKNIVIAM